MTADPRTTFQSGAQKDLKGPRPALIPPNAMLEVAEVYGYGARKYTSRNWEAGLPFTDVLDASMRHLLKFLAGVDRDDESGLHHLAHSVFGLLSVLEYSLTESGEDDRTGLRPAAGVYTPPSLSVVESLQETPTKGTDMSDNKPTPEQGETDLLAALAASFIRARNNPNAVTTYKVNGKKVKPEDIPEEIRRVFAVGGMIPTPTDTDTDMEMDAVVRVRSALADALEALNVTANHTGEATEDLGYDDREDLHMHIDAAAHQVRAALRILDITE